MSEDGELVNVMERPWLPRANYIDRDKVDDKKPSVEVKLGLILRQTKITGTQQYSAREPVRRPANTGSRTRQPNSCSRHSLRIRSEATVPVAKTGILLFDDRAKISFNFVGSERKMRGLSTGVLSFQDGVSRRRCNWRGSRCDFHSNWGPSVWDKICNVTQFTIHTYKLGISYYAS